MSTRFHYLCINVRKSSLIKPKPKTTWAMVLGRLKEMKFCTTIRTKEEVNKEELAAWPAERIDLVGARRVDKDQFWYEVNEERIADVARAMLQEVAGVESAAGLTVAGRREVLSHLRRVGFKSRAGGGRFSGRPEMEGLEGTGKKAMLLKIEAYLAEAKRPWSYVHSMAKRMCKVDRVEWCDPDQLRDIVAALEYDAHRHGRYTG